MQGRWQLWERAGVEAQEWEHGAGRKQGPGLGQARGIREAEVGSGAAIWPDRKGYRSWRERLRVLRGRGLVACGWREDWTFVRVVERRWEVRIGLLRLCGGRF